MEDGTPLPGGYAYLIFTVGNGEQRHDRRPTIAQAKLAICSLRLQNVSSPIIAVTAHVDEYVEARLFKAGADAVCNFTHWDWPLHNWHPVYDENTQHRKDGALTYYRFLAFNFTDFSRVILADADVWWFENPETMFNVPMFPFVSFEEGRVRSPYHGFNMHVSLIQPDAVRFNRLLSRAATGDYIPFINTEQDVFDAEFATEHVIFGEKGTHCARKQHSSRPPEESKACIAYRYADDANDELHLTPDLLWMLPS